MAVALLRLSQHLCQLGGYRRIGHAVIALCGGFRGFRLRCGWGGLWLRFKRRLTLLAGFPQLLLIVLPLLLCRSRLGGLLAIEGAVLLVVGRIGIGEETFVEILHVVGLGHERGAGGILAAAVDLHAKDGCHLVLVVDQVTPLLSGDEHHLDAFARGGDVDEQDAQLAEVAATQDGIDCLLGVGHMIHIDHHESRQMGGGVLAPQGFYTFLINREAEASLEAAHGQTALLGVLLRVAIGEDEFTGAGALGCTVEPFGGQGCHWAVKAF